MTSKRATLRLAKNIGESANGDYAKLYIDYSDRYLSCKFRSIVSNQTAQEKYTTKYKVEWECEPWINGPTRILNVTGNVDTDQVGRTIADGSWSPITANISGTNITVSGYTETGESTGYISVSGYVERLIIDSSRYTATIDGENAVDRLYNVDFALYVGTGKTFFAVGGSVINMTLQYNDRWY